MKRVSIVDVALVGGLAFLVRLIYVSQLAGTPFFESPIVDAEFHDAWARNIIEKGIGHEGPFFRAPLYSYFLAFIYHLTNESYFAARLAQTLLGTATAILTFLLGLELTKRRSVALMAGVGSALYGMLIYFDGELLVETLFVPLLLSTCLAYAKTRAKKKLTYLLLPGFLLGLAVITRPSALILTPIFLIDILLMKHEIGAQETTVGKLIRSFALFCGLLIPILPVTWHNAFQGGDFVLVATSGGVNFYIGNNTESDGLHSHLPGMGSNWEVPAASMLAYQAEGRVLKPSEVSSYFYRKGCQFISGHPWEALKLTLRKFTAFWNRLEISNNRDLYFFESETLIMPYLRFFGFWLVAPLGLFGFWLSSRKKLLPGWFIWIVPMYMLGVIAFFVTARFRIPVVPFLLIMTGISITYLLDNKKNLFKRTNLIDLAVLAVLFAFVNVSPYNFAESNAPHAHFSLGNAFMKKGDLAGAEKAYNWALKYDPDYPLVHLNLGVAAYREGDLKKAESEYLLELAINPENAMALNNLGVLKFEAGQYELAQKYYEEALNLQPYFSDARINLAESLFKQGLTKAAENRISEAAVIFFRAIQHNGDNALYHYNYALAMGRLGYLDRALEFLERAIEISPDFSEAQQLLMQLKSSSWDDTQPSR